jgi:Mg-chelatase subunit ChlD
VAAGFGSGRQRGAFFLFFNNGFAWRIAMRACLLSVLLVAVLGTLVGCADQKEAKQSGYRASKSMSQAKSAARHPSRDESARDVVASEAADTDRLWAKHGEAETAPPASSRPSIPGYQAGTLTAGSFDDHENFADYQTYLDAAASTAQSLLPQYRLGRRVMIEVSDADGKPLGDARVVVRTKNQQSPRTLLDTTTGSDGRTLFLSQLDGAGQGSELSVSVYAPGKSLPQVQSMSLGQAPWKIQLAKAHRRLPQKLDLSLVIDATGSMSDELEYLKVEIDSIAAAVKARFPNVDQRFSLIVYRDIGDEYVVRKFDFTGSLAEFRRTLSEQRANGGGDYPEAMHTALENAVDLTWRDRDTARVMFLFADAPPHDTDAPATLAAVQQLRKKGVTIFPVAASGTKDRAEYIMRATAFLTSGQYLFLTDDSGIGNPHAAPHVPGYNVDRLDNLMVRLIAQELAGKPVPLEQISQTHIGPTVTYTSTTGIVVHRPSDWLAPLQSWPIRLTLLALLVVGVIWFDGRMARRA